MTTHLDPNRICLGQLVRDLTSGFAGYATQRSELLNGNIQYAIQPKMSLDLETPVVPDLCGFDHHLLDIEGDGISDRCTSPQATVVQVGDLVLDTVTKVEGIAVTKTTFLNGCVYFSVQRPLNKAGEVPDLHFVDHGRLKVLKSAKPAPKAERPTGGPRQRCFRPT